MSRIRKYNPRNGKGGLLLPPNLLVFVLAQLGPGRLPLPTSLLNDSQRGGQERGSKVLSLQIRVEQSPRSGKARFPGPTPSSLPSAVLLRSSPSEPPSFRRSDRSLSQGWNVLPLALVPRKELELRPRSQGFSPTFRVATRVAWTMTAPCPRAPFFLEQYSALTNSSSLCL